VTGGWRKLHNEKLHSFDSSPDIIRMIRSRRMRWAGYVACMGEMRNAYEILVGKPEGKRPLGRLGGRWEEDLMKRVFGGVDWIRLARDRDLRQDLVNTVINLRVP
jgi:hypothetical protein